jgi:tetratricopeptide (TPR) repeat protein
MRRIWLSCLRLSCFWLFVAALGLGSTLAWGQSAATGLYNDGNARYRAGDFAGSLSYYRQASSMGLEDPRLYYNLANALFKTGQLGEAILWYERALRLAPRDPDIKANLDFVNQIKKDREVQTANNLILDFLLQVFIYPEINELALLLLVSLAAIFALATWRLWNRDRTGSGWLAALVPSLFVSLLVAAWLGGRVVRLEERNQGIVLAGEATARSAPDESKTAVIIIHEGTKVRIERREDGWVLIRLANGLGGWLPAKTLETI